jgi:ADP-dependent phosphofructokinase/glucokinase
MSRNGLRAFGAGIILATSILAGLYFSEDNEVIPQEITDQDIEEYLDKRDDLVLIEEGEYKELLQFKEKANEKPPEEPVQENVEEKVITKYTLEIQSGMNSLEIARLLESVGIIEDATKLNNYILEQKLAEKIQIGSYQLISDMTLEEIADIITK